MPRLVPKAHPEVALVLVGAVDPESLRRILEIVCGSWQDGSLLLVDDWLDSRSGAVRRHSAALSAFLARHPEWKAISDRRYGLCGQSFILTRR